MSRRALVCALVVLSTVVAVAQVRLPRPPVSIPLPGIDAWTRGEPALTTSLADARIDVPWLDQLEVTFQDLDTLRNNRGTFTLRPGHWSVDVQSFCLLAGTRGPQATDGRGYLLAPLLGSRAALVKKLLDSYGVHRDIPQHEMQMLLWGITSKAKMKQMAPTQQRLAERLLSPAELLQLDGGAVDVIPAALRNRVFGSVPAPLRAVMEAENSVREIMGRAGTTYADVERIAVRGGPEGTPDRLVPKGRWSAANGMLVRIQPTLYSRSTIQIVVPGKYVVQRDALGRIISLDFGDGRRTETEYDDTIPPYHPEGTTGVTAYAFKVVRLLRRGVDGQTERLTVDRDGWTFVNRVGPQLSPQPLVVRAAYRQNPLDRFRQWKERYDRFNSEYRERAEWYRQRWDRRREPPPDVQHVLRDLEDMQHYRSAIDAVLTGGQAGQLGWLIEHQERMNGAVERATLEIAGVGETPDEFSPSDHVAVPGHNGSQRLGMSARRF